MKYIDEFRNKRLAQILVRKIIDILPVRAVNIMEVCGTHTQNFYRFGLDRLLPPGIRFISGPGCPVCVSPERYIDDAIKLARRKNFIIVTFGDMLRIPGSNSSLENERAKNANVRVIYSPLESLTIAKLNPDKKVVFLAVGFETTAPGIALTILMAKKERLKNLFFLTSRKLIPAAMRNLLLDKRLKLDAFLCPGHVSAIIGTKDYAQIVKKYRIGCCVAGFEPVDILEGIFILLKQIAEKRPKMANQYMRVVRREGNPKAKKIINRVFKKYDSLWRGLGMIPDSGLKIKNEFAQFDAGRFLPISKPTKINRRQAQCRCAEVLKGLISPIACKLFSRVCSPENPLGACMVSSEGACNAQYKYKCYG
ncbi:MAG: hydrogenase formation protein HypD [Candidatus Omnitrophica bacterium]|nr:hydrogenase formation protein HypD [Candidatus Omnitrophota bacterium]